MAPIVEQEPKKSSVKKKIAGFFRILGPGIISGAADDDPSGIATYSQTGAQFGFGQLWTSLYQIPLLLAVQEACGRIGAVTGKGLAGVIKEHYSKKILIGVVVLVAVANTINIGADIGAVAAAAQLVVNVPFWLLAVATTALLVVSEVLITYKTYANVLKWLALALLSYPATALIVKQPWKEILYATVVPHIELSFAFFFIITGVFGTSISPYMFFWQASEEVEEERAMRLRADKDGKPRLPRRFIRDMRIDTLLGMLSAELAQWFIIITTATVLFKHGTTTINTAADAAKALEPLVRSFPNSGQVAKDVFAVGIIGLGLLGIPVLAGSAAYALSEAFGWKEGLSKKFKKARGFYGVIIVSMLIGLLLNFIGIDPMKALVFTAVFNGIAAVPLLYLIAKINASPEILAEQRGGGLSRSFVWVTFGVMGLSAVALLYTLIFQHLGR
ncbi:MAG TPA: divalent metal cation transporter [Edaphobacter sp.]|uniref:NRAMP family divalent metal transporter n=1 Tax=Edaphobacter sp. TaxID=1934404 RepID=UPI002BB37547|nr:divalent metal cation transporter [Edaphobacter sp.]HUZ97202.1 divalent metal cation transporter [Edaphobacter sp.]